MMDLVPLQEVGEMGIRGMVIVLLLTSSSIFLSHMT